MVGPITASIDSLAVGWMRLFDSGIKGGFGFWSVVASLKAVKAVANPRLAAIPAKGADAASGVLAAGLGLVLADHNDTVMG